MLHKNQIGLRSKLDEKHRYPDMTVKVLAAVFSNPIWIYPRT
ncbi:hypothetical protein EKH55_5147 [Sinorhizobium alkalisoli]|nr:hypothetical protein EKH55_5147 [Sinorhizobium alkalisoli]